MNDARREEQAALLPPIDPGPAALSVWQTVQVLGSQGQVMRSITLYVPTSGRCDQHAAEIDGQRRGLLTATEVGRMVAGMLAKRPSLRLRAAMRDCYSARDEADAATAQMTP